MIRVAIAGTGNNLGSAIADMVGTTLDMALTGTNHDRADRVAYSLGDSDVLIDVSNTGTVMRHALECVKFSRPIVIGVPDLDPNHIAELKEYGQRIPVFYTSNFCIETAAILSLMPLITQTLPHLHFEVSGRDEHLRRHPLEILSGGSTTPQSANDPAICFVGPDQEIMLCQRVLSLNAYARGALEAARLVVQQKSGFFTMDDLVPQHGRASLIPALTSTMVDAR